MPRRRQCAKCPWKRSTNPLAIPGGYSEAKHCALRSTIARSPLASLFEPVVAMACHETTGGVELPCVGWLAHQLGDGNNVALRLMALRDPALTAFDLVGPQHATFEATLPRSTQVTGSQST